MNLSKASCEILGQLQALCNNIGQEDYAMSLDYLHQASIGQHVRHTIEFFSCLQKGSTCGVVNYDHRERNRELEQNNIFAHAKIEALVEWLASLDQDKDLRLEISYNPEKEQPITINTTLMREVAYNIEHAVHHMALIKIGLKVTENLHLIKSDFGVAVSTLRYQKELEQVNS